MKSTQKALLVLFTTGVLAVPAYLYGKERLREEWGNRYDAIQKRVCAQVPGECLVRFSAYKEDFLGLPKDNLEEIPHSGRIRFVAKRDSWREREYESPILTSPTWLEIAKAANEMIKVTGDTHHIFLEDLEVLDKQGDVTLADFAMGS